MLNNVILFAAIFVVSFSASAQQPEYITPTDEKISVGMAGDDQPDIARFLLARGARGPLISPNGAHVIYTYDVTGTRQLWISDVETGEARRLTFGNGVSFYSWKPDSSAILYGADNDGNELESYYLISADGASEHLVLAAVEGGYRQFGGFSPDGDKIAFASTERNGNDFDIYVADLNANKTRRLYEGKNHFAAHAWSPDGDSLIVTEAVGEDADNLYLLDVETGALNTLFKPDSYANFSSGWGFGPAFSWGPDGDGFYFSTNHEREFLALSKYDVVSGTLSMLEAPEHDIQNVKLCGERYLAWTENSNGVDTLKIRDLKRNRLVTPPTLPEGVYIVSCAKDKNAMSIGVSSYNAPGDVYYWDFTSRAAKKIFSSTLAGLDKSKLVKPIVVRPQARDGVLLQGLLYLPQRADSSEKPPVLFDVHGGPTAESRARWDPTTQYHVALGTAVFAANVRGSTGFGRTYLSLDNQEKRLDSVRDLVDMLNYLKKDGRVDADRAIVSGGSYGGYMVNAVLGSYPGAFIAGVSQYGVGDWVTALQIASPALKASDLIEYGDISEQKWIDFYKENSPIQNANAITVPVLYSHGAQDPRIDKSETEIMVRALRSNGVEAPYILIPDEGHGWRKLKNQLFYYRREAEFLKAQFER